MATYTRLRDNKCIKPVKATSFSFRLRLHYKAALAGGIKRLRRIKREMIYGLIFLVFVSLFIYGCATNMKKLPSISDQALIDLARGFSGNDDVVMNEVSLFVSNRTKYFKKYEDDLFERGIEEPVQITPPIALIDALSKAKYLVYQDGSSEPGWALDQLDKLSGNAISKARRYDQLKDYYSDSKYGIGTFLDGDGEWPSIFECIKSVGFHLLAINEDSDSYALALVPNKDLPVVLETAHKAGISLYFTQK